MCNIRNLIYGLASFILCSVLVYSILSNNPEPDFQAIELEDIITNQKDLTALQNLGVRDFVCYKEKGSDVVLCTNKGTSHKTENQ